MAEIFELSKIYGFKIIEDASHAIGAKYKNKPIGSCDYSDLTVFSFHPVKIITTGEGGMVVANDEYLAKKLRLLRSHGITRDVSEMTKMSEGLWYYQQIELGYNYRMTDIQAALGLSQLRRLNDYVQARHIIANRYDSLLSAAGFILPKNQDDRYSGLHLYIIQLDSTSLGSTRAKFFESLRNKDIGVNVHYIPVHLHPYYLNMGFKNGNFPAAEIYYERAITIPMYPSLTENQQNYISETLIKLAK
jgi:dTDP-4-amino-4,6-dideoxygalactose transaminase